VATLAIDCRCPEHGDIYRGTDAQHFMRRFQVLQIGVIGG